MTAKRFGFGDMLPDLRVLLLATITTFMLATCVGLYASVRLLPEPLTSVQPDRDTPVNRVALSWQDLNRAPQREFTPVALHEEAPVTQQISDTPQPAETPKPKAEDRPFVPVPTENAPARPSGDQSVVEKTVPTEDPTTTGAIGEAPAASTANDQPKFAARPEPVDAAPPSAAPASALPATPAKVRKAKSEPRKQRRHRIARQSSPQGTAPSNEPVSNVFTEFGSRVQ